VDMLNRLDPEQALPRRKVTVVADVHEVLDARRPGSRGRSRAHRLRHRPERHQEGHRRTLEALKMSLHDLFHSVPDTPADLTPPPSANTSTRFSNTRAIG
jgi:hypothetical protein